HPGVAGLLRQVLETDFEVVATVADGRALVEAAEAVGHDVIVTDIAMPHLDGIAAARAIRRQEPDARIVLVTVHADPALVRRGRAAGVLGYVLKMVAGDELVPAVHAALAGKRHLSEGVTEALS